MIAARRWPLLGHAAHKIRLTLLPAIFILYRRHLARELRVHCFCECARLVKVSWECESQYSLIISRGATCLTVAYRSMRH